MFGPPSEACGAGRSHGIDIALKTAEKTETPSRPCQSSSSRVRRIRKRKRRNTLEQEQQERSFHERFSSEIPADDTRLAPGPKASTVFHFHRPVDDDASRKKKKIKPTEGGEHNFFFELKERLKKTEGRGDRKIRYSSMKNN